MRLFCISTATFLALGCSPKWAEDTEPEEVLNESVTDADNGDDDADGSVEDDEDDVVDDAEDDTGDADDGNLDGLSDDNDDEVIPLGHETF